MAATFLPRTSRLCHASRCALPYISPIPPLPSPLYLASLPREQVRALAAELQRAS